MYTIESFLCLHCCLLNFVHKVTGGHGNLLCRMQKRFCQSAGQSSSFYSSQFRFELACARLIVEKFCGSAYCFSKIFGLNFVACILRKKKSHTSQDPMKSKLRCALFQFSNTSLFNIFDYPPLLTAGSRGRVDVHLPRRLHRRSYRLRKQQRNLLYVFPQTPIMAEISPRSAAPPISCSHLAGLERLKQYIMHFMTVIFIIFRFVKIIWVLPNRVESTFGCYQHQFPVVEKDVGLKLS